MENKDFTQKQMLLKQSIINFIAKHDVVINYSSLSFKGSWMRRKSFSHSPTTRIRLIHSLRGEPTKNVRKLGGEALYRKKYAAL